MKKLIFGLTMTFTGAFFVMLLIMSYTEGHIFSLNEFYSFLLESLSEKSFFSSSTFSRISDLFAEVSHFRVPTLSDGVLALLKQLFKFITLPIRFVFNVAFVPLSLLIDLIQVVESLISSLGNSWILPTA